MPACWKAGQRAGPIRTPLSAYAKPRRHARLRADGPPPQRRSLRTTTTRAYLSAHRSARPPMAWLPAGPGCVRTMSLTATARSIPGTLRQEVVIDGQHRLITDEPVGSVVTSAPAPHELLPAALAAASRRRSSCMRGRRAGGWVDVFVKVDYDNCSTPAASACRCGGLCGLRARHVVERRTRWVSLI